MTAVASRTALVIEGMKGLGDNIYQRAFVRVACSRYDVWLETPWPELYHDLPVRFLRMSTPLRTQQKNINRQPESRWSSPPDAYGAAKFGYESPIVWRWGMVRAMERYCAIAAPQLLPPNGETLLWDLPDFGPSPVQTDKPIALVRPVTLREEWWNAARNPAPEYIAAIAAALMETHYVVSVADCIPRYERIVPPAPPSHVAFHAGELPVTALLALVQHASLLLGGVGWIVPAAIAAHVPAFIVLGGDGGHNAPEKVTDPRMDLSLMGWAMPDNFCRCKTLRCTGDKTIGDPLGQFERWRRGLGL